MPEKYTLQSLIVQLENKRQEYNYCLAFRKEYKHACNISDIMKYYIDNKYNLRYFNNVKLRVICVLRYSTLHLQILWTLSYPAKKIHRFNLLLKTFLINSADFKNRICFQPSYHHNHPDYPRHSRAYNQDNPGHHICILLLRRNYLPSLLCIRTSSRAWCLRLSRGCNMRPKPLKESRR